MRTPTPDPVPADAPRVFLAGATFKPAGAIILPATLVLYTVAVRGDRRRTVIVGVAALAVGVTAIFAVTPHGLPAVDIVQKLALLVLPLILGEAVREHRANVAAMQERAERAERTREEEARRRVGEERLRIARDVHDVVAHSMVAINVQAGVAAHLLDRRPEAARGALTEIKRVSGEALADLRATLGVLRTDEPAAPTAPAAGLAALPELADRLRGAGLDVALEIRSGERPVPSAVEAAGYRIVQEALTNVAKHARASRVQITIGECGGDIELTVADDGMGFDTAQRSDGFGLLGMRERLALVGGTLAVESAPRAGTTLRAAIPARRRSPQPV